MEINNIFSWKWKPPSFQVVSGERAGVSQLHAPQNKSSGSTEIFGKFISK
jgi:hypothetical protein